MKQDRDEQQDKKKTKSLLLITAKQNATDVQTLLVYLKLQQPEVKNTPTQYGAIAIRG